MVHIRFVGSLVLALALVATGGAQSGKVPPAVQFKQFGATPEQFWQSSVLRWTGQLSLDLEAVKREVAAARLTPAARAALTAQVDDALAQTLQLDRLLRTGAARDKVYPAFADVEKSFHATVTGLNQQQAAVPSLARADTAFHQLAAAVGAGDTNPDRAKRRLVRLGESLDDNADELRSQYADQIGGNDRAFERAMGQYAREARLLARRARDGADADLINNTYAAMGARWGEAVGTLTRTGKVPAALREQVTKLDTLHRRLGGVLTAPGQPGQPNPAPVPLPAPEGKRFAFAAGTDAGGPPHVRVFSDEKGTVAYSFLAYDKAFTGGVRVDMADLNGDRVPDLIVAPGPSATAAGLPVRVYDGRDLNLLVEFVPFANWKGGVYTAGSDLSKDGRALIAVTAEGTQHVKIFDLAQGKEVDSFLAHDQKVTGGVRLAWGDADGDGVPDLFTANGPGNAVTSVKVYSGKNRAVLAEFPAVDNKYRGGAYIAAGDLTGSGRADAVVGADAGTVPLVRVLDMKGKLLVEWLAYDERFKGGVRVAISASHHVITAPGGGLKNSPLRLFDAGRVKTPVGEIAPFPGFDGGLNIGGR